MKEHRLLDLNLLELYVLGPKSSMGDSLSLLLHVEHRSVPRHSFKQRFTCHRRQNDHTFAFA
eukprot:1572491-Amphidinium_carterae.1